LAVEIGLGWRQGQRSRRTPPQREGIAKAKGEGKYKGRAPTARRQADDIVRFAGEGVKREEIAAKLGVGVSSVYRVLAEQKGARGVS